MLHERLFGVLRSDASKIGRSHLDFDFVAELRVGLDPPGVENGNLIVLGCDSLGDDQLGEGADVPRLGVDGATQFTGGPDGFFGRGQQGFFNGLDQDILVDALLAFPIF